MTNIRTIGNATDPTEPDSEIVSDIEDLLNMARSGDLRGIAYVTVRKNNVVGSRWIGSGKFDQIGTGILMLMHRFGASQNG